jgi:hypothetical protein
MIHAKLLRNLILVWPPFLIGFVKMLSWTADWLHDFGLDGMAFIGVYMMMIAPWHFGLWLTLPDDFREKMKVRKNAKKLDEKNQKVRDGN